MYSEKEIERAVKRAVHSLVSADIIYFTFAAEQEEFIENCVFEIIQKFDSEKEYSPDYIKEALSMYNPDEY